MASLLCYHLTSLGACLGASSNTDGKKNLVHFVLGTMNKKEGGGCRHTHPFQPHLRKIKKLILYNYSNNHHSVLCVSLLKLVCRCLFESNLSPLCESNVSKCFFQNPVQCLPLGLRLVREKEVETKGGEEAHLPVSPRPFNPDPLKKHAERRREQTPPLPSTSILK